MGAIIDTSSQKAIMGATVAVIPYKDSTRQSVFLTDKNGGFTFNNLELGYYRLQITAVGFRTLTIDSIHLRTDRADFNFNDIPLSNQSVELAEVIIFVEKPLIESKDGNITFNVGESALSNGSSATELLKQTPLVTTDPNGKILVRGKEPKILIDDKPVELNLQQLQDLLESLPGSSIEKIESVFGEGVEKMKYSALKVWDANGVELRAYFEKSENQKSQIRNSKSEIRLVRP